MKQLTLIRHAKSSWKIEGLDDTWRPLNRRGYEQLSQMAPHVPDAKLWLVSPAVRAYTTAMALRSLRGDDLSQLQLEAGMLSAPGGYLLELVRQQHAASLVLVGHNPGLDELADYLLPEPIASLSSGAVLQLRLAIGQWSDCTPGCAEVVALYQPE